MRGLLVFSPTAADNGICRRRFGGLRTYERGIRTLARAGVDHLVVVLPDGVDPRIGTLTRRLDLQLEFVNWGQTPDTTANASEPVLLLLGDHVHHHSSLSAFVEEGLARLSNDIRLVAQVSPTPEQSIAFHGLQTAPEGPAFPDVSVGQDGVSTGAFLCAARVTPHDMIASRQSPLAFFAERCRGAEVATMDGTSSLWRRVVDRRSARQAKAMLFGQVTKKTSGPVSRHINARLSIPISKVLIETGISPHMVTVLFVLTTGLATAWLVARPEPYWRLALGGVFWQMAAVLDRCDGEIARVKLCESKFGAWFDTITDNIAYLATYVAFLFGVHHLHPDKPWALYLGISAIGAMVIALGVMYNYALKTGSGSLQNYLVGFRSHVLADEKNGVYRTLERYAFIAKRDFFAFVHFLCCILGSFELLYAYTVGGLHLIVLGVLISQRKMLAGHRRLAEAVPR
ncbi:MAG TPA: CDP-alcohol phosphatidyltransferase family protein [Candidatus Latescibacteria bacterium]|jgi:phosphatidylglycerophosphate synthase|nr:hypothetical protein [Gemmatimonadaceae bacterium]MDP6019367.1 CDP-alcohol phosphatidyltransferase family protein [Candidatus Latescibacterota bacterium]HJP29370.1 CDP-alcohol phosphatidyltransferase family protein [Candidatus Latescibacterota bacterium]